MALAMQDFMMSRLSDLRWTELRRRVRGLVSGHTVIDSTRVRYVSEPKRVVGTYAVAMADVEDVLARPTSVRAADVEGVLTPEHAFTAHTCPGRVWDIRVGDRVLEGAGFSPDDPDLADYVLLDWNAFDEWREEEDRAIGHPRDPFHRIDCLVSSRHVIVSSEGVVLADSRRPTVLLETHLPARHYIPREDVRMDLLVPSDTRTTCAYKGLAAYWSAAVGGRVVDDVAWTYADPISDGMPVRDLICFYDERVDVKVVAAHR